MWSSNYFLYPLHNKIFIISLNNCKGCLSSLYCKYWHLKLNCYPFKKLFLLFFNRICMITFCRWACISIRPPHRILLKSSIFLFPIVFLCKLHTLIHLCVCVCTYWNYIYFKIFCDCYQNSKGPKVYLTCKLASWSVSV